MSQYLKDEFGDDNDYFERGIEYSIQNGMKIMPVNLGENLCIEIDFEDEVVSSSKTQSMVASSGKRPHEEMEILSMGSASGFDLGSCHEGELPEEMGVI